MLAFKLYLVFFRSNWICKSCPFRYNLLIPISCSPHTVLHWKIEGGEAKGLVWLATGLQSSCFRVVGGGCALWESKFHICQEYQPFRTDGLYWKRFKRTFIEIHSEGLVFTQLLWVPRGKKSSTKSFSRSLVSSNER